MASFDLAGIERRRDRLFREVFSGLLAQTIDGGVIQEMVVNLKRHMPDYVSRDVLFESVRHLAGQPLTDALAMQTAWRLAGNLPRLRLGQPAGPWTSQAEKEPVPLQILRVTPGVNSRNDSGYNVSFRALAGSCCPRVLSSFWKLDLVRYVVGQIGFSRWKESKYPFHMATEFVGLRLVGEMDPEKSRYEPVFWTMEFPPSFVQWNRETVLRQRCRVIPCPRGFTEPCRNCAVGYNECIGATHKLAYVQQGCPSCIELAWFDPELGMDRCIKCHHKNLTRKR